MLYLSEIYIHAYIHLQTQSGDHAITHSCRLHQPHMVIGCRYNQYALVNFNMGDKHNEVVIFNPKITRKT